MEVGGPHDGSDGSAASRSWRAAGAISRGVVCVRGKVELGETGRGIFEDGVRQYRKFGESVTAARDWPPLSTSFVRDRSC